MQFEKILDPCCGSRMFYFDKNNKDVLFCDCRTTEDVLCDGRKLSVKPDIISDVRNLPFADNTYNLVIFDPPHLVKVGDNSWMHKKYGRLPKDFKKFLTEAFK